MDGISRILAYGNKVTIRQVESNVFKSSGNLVMQLLGNSQLLKFDDRCNDLDFFSALRFTIKGPNSLGQGKAERNISDRYRGTDPSYLGNIDINVYSSSSPGLNGSLSPFTNTHGLYFNDEPEPQNMEYDIYKELSMYHQSKGRDVIEIGSDPISYYNGKYKLIRNARDNFNVTHMSEDGCLYIDMVVPE